MTLTKELAFQISKKYISDEHKLQGGFYSVMSGCQLRVASSVEYKRYSTDRKSSIVRLYVSKKDNEEVRFLIPIVKLKDGTSWAFRNGSWEHTREERGRVVKPYFWTANTLRCSIMNNAYIDVKV